MNALKATKTVSVLSASASAIREHLEDLKSLQLEHGALYKNDAGVVIFASEENATLFAPALLEHFDGRDAIVVYKKDEKVYFFATFNGNFIDEFEFSITDSDSNDIERLRRFCSLYPSELSSTPFYSNVNAEAADENSVLLDGIELPLSIEREKGFQELKSLKPVLASELEKELARTSTSKFPFKWLLVLSVIGFFSYLYFPADEPIEIVADDKNREVKVINHYLGLKHFYTDGKRGVNPKPILRDVYQQLMSAKQLRGWEISEVKVVNEGDGQVTEYLVLTSTYGLVAELTQFAHKGKYNLNVSGSEAFLARKIYSENIYNSYGRFHVGTFHNWLSSATDDLWDDVDYAIIPSQSETSSRWQISEAEITFPIFHPEDLESFGSLLKGFPYSFSYLEMKTINPYVDAWEAVVKLEIAGVETNA